MLAFGIRMAVAIGLMLLDVPLSPGKASAFLML